MYTLDISSDPSEVLSSPRLLVHRLLRLRLQQRCETLFFWRRSWFLVLFFSERSLASARKFEETSDATVVASLDVSASSCLTYRSRAAQAMG